MKSPQVQAVDPDRDHYSELQILRSAAGYYVGTAYTDPETGWTMPGSRDSDYFPTRAAAEGLLGYTETTGDTGVLRKTP